MEVNRFLIFIVSISLLFNSYSDNWPGNRIDELEKELAGLKASGTCSN
jgi:hypothetical protein